MQLRRGHSRRSAERTVCRGSGPSKWFLNYAALPKAHELSIPVHLENAFKTGAKIYLASIAKTANGVGNATKALSNIASKYSLTVVMCNCVGHVMISKPLGRTAIWNDKGALVPQLDDTNEDILII